jgi:butyryl-CoA dehydrogenase
MSVLISSRDLQFILFELLNVETLCKSDRYAHCDKATFEATLDTAHQIALDRFDPLAKICDEAEPRIEEGRTILPDGVAKAVKAYVDAGLLNASADLSEGGLDNATAPGPSHPAPLLSRVIRESTRASRIAKE